MSIENAQKSLLIQGWTGINHSYAMVNQYQLLSLQQLPGLALWHQDMPLFDTRWTKDKNDSGFSAAEQAAIAAIPTWERQPVDAVYKIHSPNLVAASAAREITFLVTELGLDERSFAPGTDINAYVAQGNVIVTPSQWSRERIIDYGFSPESVYVIPHGVDTSKFAPYDEAQRRTARESLGYAEDDCVFLNVGAPIWNKGLDLIIQAFFTLRQTNKKARLLIKDQQALYGLSSVQMIKKLSDSGAITIDNDSVESIRVLPQTVSIAQLCSLYNVADCYLSPYRAEGFNLPVIEAIACGTPVIVTEGGATDDFCNPYVSQKIPGKKVVNTVINDTKIGAYVQPDMDALVQLMQSASHVQPRMGRDFSFGRSSMLEQFHWQRAARQIVSLI